MRAPQSPRHAAPLFNLGSGSFAGCALLVGSVVALAIPADASDEPEVPEAAEACLACHAYLQDEPPQIAPSLWGLVGRPVASAADFEYSPALKALGGTWERALLDRFLANPKAVAPGTAMTMGGVADAAERAIVLDFLETLAPKPPR